MSEAAIQEELAAMYASPFQAVASNQYSAQATQGLKRPSIAASLALMERRAASMPSLGSLGLETITESDDEGQGYGSPVWTRPIHKANSWSGVVVPVGVPARVRGGVCPALSTVFLHLDNFRSHSFPPSPSPPLPTLACQVGLNGACYRLLTQALLGLAHC